MRDANKLLLELDGRTTVLARVAKELKASPFCEFVAVTGHQADLVEPLLSVYDFKLVRNSNFSSGMHSSIRCGLEALDPSRADFFAVCLADQPFLTRSDYAAMIEAATAQSEAPLLYPVIDGERGQPVLISMKLRDEILAHDDDDRGCHYLFKKYGGRSVDLSHSANALAFYDVDTPEMFAHARRHATGGFRERL